MKAIGGYFELELNKGREYHPTALSLNSGRNAFEYILRTKRFIKVYIPFYTCDALLSTMQKLELPYEFYHINENFEPSFDFSNLRDNEAFVYINYFGLFDNISSAVASKHKNIIIDNSQSFFSIAPEGKDTFYSVRKFFGVPDGAYLYTDEKSEIILEQESSYKRSLFLLKRIDLGAKEGYPDFLKNEKKLAKEPLKKMSSLTKAILQNIDYAYIKEARNKNFLFLHKAIKHLNRIKLDHINGQYIPMVYPLLTDDMNLKKHLHENNVYAASYWKGSVKWQEKKSFETELCKKLIALPIDQRCSQDDIQRIINIINS